MRYMHIMCMEMVQGVSITYFDCALWRVVCRKALVCLEFLCEPIK
jgi:hypothetical protein